MSTHRLNKEEALTLLQSAPQLELMERADAMRRAKHPNNEVTFVIDTNPNYTNVCITDCTFCSFYRKPNHDEAYVLSPDEIAAKAVEAQASGATTMLLQGGHNRDLGIEYYLAVIHAVSEAAPELHRHFFSPSEIEHIAIISDMTTSDVLQEFWDAGQRTMPGGGAEILLDSVRRRVSPKKTSGQAWLEIMRQAHRIGFKTSATMTYGHLESEEDIIEHLFMLRELQNETGGFYSFIPWSFKPGDSPLSRLVPHAQRPSYYVRIIAIARLVLDNIDHIQASWFGEGWRAGQLALYAGANDFGGLLLEENVLYQAEHKYATTLNHVLTTIGDAGFTPVQRTTGYEKISYPCVVENEHSEEPVHERVNTCPETTLS